MVRGAGPTGQNAGRSLQVEGTQLGEGVPVAPAQNQRSHSDGSGLAANMVGGVAIGE